jgi:predicted enzyme related to lactoylglutathione lyase
MSERSGYAPGEFCWVDLSTTDMDAAAGYYGDLLGVKAEAAPGDVGEAGGYGFFTNGGKQVAGYAPVMDGGHPAWMGYVCVEDADATAEKVKAAGGEVVAGPFDLPNDSGRSAVFRDPEGAFFSVVQLGTHEGAQLVNEVGSWTWNQLQTRDPEGAEKFYGEVFGWRFDAMEDAPAPYWMVQIDGQAWPEGAAGAMDITGAMPDEVPAHWLVYLGVEDADAAAEKTTAAGGQILFPPSDIAVGRIVGLSDPQGAAFAAIKPAYEEPR